MGIALQIVGTNGALFVDISNMSENEGEFLDLRFVALRYLTHGDTVLVLYGIVTFDAR